LLKVQEISAAVKTKSQLRREQRKEQVKNSSVRINSLGKKLHQSASQTNISKNEVTANLKDFVSQQQMIGKAVNLQTQRPA